jgi:hypothetical protein
MIALQPAFANLHNFVHFIVLNNCVDYFSATKSNPSDSTRRDELRHLFNAVVALDSAVDHAFAARPRTMKFPAFFEELAKREPAILRVRELANALKHCVTNSQARPNAVDLAQTTVHVEVDACKPEPVVNVRLSTSVLGDVKQTIEAAFNFWRDYAQHEVAQL